MRFKAGKSGPVLDARAKVTLTPVGDVYDCDWSLKVRLGRKVFGKFIGRTQRESGSLRIPKKSLKEDLIFKAGAFEIAGLEFKRETEQRFSFQKGAVKGQVWFGFDGHDPVEIRRIKVSALGMKLDLRGY